jgi:hypothetical protein
MILIAMLLISPIKFNLLLAVLYKAISMKNTHHEILWTQKLKMKHPP